MPRAMARTVVLSAIALAAASFALEWLEYKYFTKAYSVEIYIVLIALGFAALGLWVGRRLSLQNPRGPFERNRAALKSLGNRTNTQNLAEYRQNPYRQTLCKTGCQRPRAGD